MNFLKESQELLVIVPARLGSTRVKLKNLRLLGDKPLIEYILTTLKRTQYLNNIYINSDSDFFKKIAERNKVKFYQRPKNLGTSSSLIDDYIYNFMLNIPSKYLAVVNPTSPFITEEELDNAWEHFLTKELDTLLTCDKIQTHCFLGGNPVNFSIKGKHPRSQDLEPVRALNFAITIWKCDAYLRNYKKNSYGVYTGKIGFYDLDGAATIDVDYEHDFQKAELYLEILKYQHLKTNPKYDPIVQKLIEQDIKTEN